jgi:hypothetical protein
VRQRRGISQIFVVDFLSALVLLLFALVKLADFDPKHRPPRIDTYGVYAVTVAWAQASNDDVDTYVQDAQGEIAYFTKPDAGLMHLEHDDLGRANDSEGAVVVNHNGERVILRGEVPGEYVVNVDMYEKNDPGSTRVEVSLYRLRGEDALVMHRSVTLRRVREEQTAFRFTLNAAGDVTDRNELPKKLVDQVAVA